MTEKEMRDWIDSATYKMLLQNWRFAPSGDPLLQGDMGKYYAKVMGEKRKKLAPGEDVIASKEIGWKP